MKPEREINRKRLLTIGNKLRVAGGTVVGDGVTGWWALGGHICDEHWVLYATDESLYSAPKLVIDNMLINSFSIKFLKRKYPQQSNNANLQAWETVIWASSYQTKHSENGKEQGSFQSITYWSCVKCQADCLQHALLLSFSKCKNCHRHSSTWRPPTLVSP